MSLARHSQDRYWWWRWWYWWRWGWWRWGWWWGWWWWWLILFGNKIWCKIDWALFVKPLFPGLALHYSRKSLVNSLIFFEDKENLNNLDWRCLLGVITLIIILYRMSCLASLAQRRMAWSVQHMWKPVSMWVHCFSCSLLMNIMNVRSTQMSVWL